MMTFTLFRKGGKPQAPKKEKKKKKKDMGNKRRFEIVIGSFLKNMLIRETTFSCCTS